MKKVSLIILICILFLFLFEGAFSVICNQTEPVETYNAPYYKVTLATNDCYESSVYRVTPGYLDGTNCINSYKCGTTAFGVQINDYGNPILCNSPNPMGVEVALGSDRVYSGSKKNWTYVSSFSDQNNCEWTCLNGSTPLGNTCVFLESCDGLDNDGDGVIDQIDTDGDKIFDDSSVCDCYNPTDSVYPAGEVLGINSKDLMLYLPFDQNILNHASSSIVSTGYYIIGDGIRLVGAPPSPEGYVDGTTHIPNSYSANASFGNSAFFDGGGIAYGNLTDNQNTFSLFTWINSEFPVSNEVSRFIAGMYYDQAYDGFHFEVKDTSQILSVSFRKGGSAYYIVDGPALIDNTWYHVGFVRNGSSVKLYVNGEEVNSLNNLPLDWNPPSAYDDFTVASDSHHPGRTYKGYMDDFVLFHRALNDCEIKKLAKGPNACLDYCTPQETCNGIDDDGDGLIDEDGVCVCYKTEAPNGNIYSLDQTLGINADGLVSYWKMDDSTNGTTLNEKGGTAQLGSSAIGDSKEPTLQSVDCVFGNCFKFNPDLENYIHGGNFSGYNSPSFSISVWIKSGIQSPFLTYTHGFVAGSFNYAPDVGGTDCAKGYSIQTFNTPGLAGLRIDPDPCNDVDVYTRSDSFNFSHDQWYNVVATYDATTKQGKLYIDGDLLSIRTYPITWGTSDLIEFTMGSVLSTAYGNAFDYNGLMDEVSYWNKPLDWCEAKQIAKGPSACLSDCTLTNFCLGDIAHSHLVSADENVLTSADVNTVLLIDEGNNTTRKCEAICDYGYHREGQTCVSNTGGSCFGDIDSNAILISGDDEDLLVNTEKLLVDSNSDNKCEYVCKDGYYRVDQNCLVNVGGSCLGDIPSDANLCLDDAIDLGAFNVTRSLIGNSESDCTPLKCEYYCRDGFVFDGSACVIPAEGEWTCSGTPGSGTGVIIGVNKYYISTYYPKTWTYNSSATGDMNCLWKCDAGYTRYGNSCVIGGSDVNNIEFIMLSVEDKNIIAEIQCSNNLTNTSFSILDEQGVDISGSISFILENGESVTNGNLDCNISKTKYILKSNSYVGDQKYLISVTIPQTCNICSRSGYVFYDKETPVTIPDANLIVAVLVACFAVFIVSKKRI